MYSSPFFETFFAKELEHPDTKHVHPGGLPGQVQLLTQQVFDLQLVVAALVRTLQAIELVDPQKLQAAVEVQLEAVRATLSERSAAEAEKHAAEIAKLSSHHGHALAPPSVDVQCPRCHRTVPSRLTVITASGIVCDVCAAAVS